MERALPHSRAKADLRSTAAPRPDDRWAADIERKVVEACHPKQRSFVLDKSRRVSARVGRGGGKTTGWMARGIIKATKIYKGKLLFIATTRQQAEDLVWSKLKDTLERLGVEAVFNETKLRCTVKRTGATIRLVGADDKREIEKLRGQSFHEVAIDEGASHQTALLDALLFRIIGPRLGDLNGVICIFGTPGHILAGEFYEATRPGGPKHHQWDECPPDWKGWSSHHWTLQDGAETVAAMGRLWAEALIEKEANGWDDDHPVWQREYMGRWAADDTANIFRYRAHLFGEAAEAAGVPDGSAWNQWDPERVGQMRFAKLPLDENGQERRDWLYVHAMDEGYIDPFALNVLAFSPSDQTRTIYHVFGFERTGMYARDVAKLMLGDDLSLDKPGGVLGVTGWPIGTIADGDEAWLAELANVYGIRAKRSERKADYKFGAIELVNGDLVLGRLKILKGSELELQLQTLQWVSNEFGERKENKAQPNHSTDCLVIGRKFIAHMFDTGEVVAAATHREPHAALYEADDGNTPDSDDFGSLTKEPDWGGLYG